MSLSKYKQKRNFNETPEPTGGKAQEDKLRFVVQKHHASRLHYDFRLEMEGVLKSWAVPKGPSTDPSVKRLAMMVEDHPYDYRNFEGVIPSGYGAGTVIVWDEGFYQPAEFDSEDKKVQDKELRKQLHAGKLKITLKGKKLKGDYALIKAHGRGDNGWLLFKIDDRYASEEDITLKEKSVISKKTLEQMEKNPAEIYGEGKTNAAVKKTAKKSVPKKTAKTPAASGAKSKTVITSGKRSAPAKSAAKKKTNEAARFDVNALLKNAPNQPFYTSLQPMLATLVDKPFDEEGWTYEVKWDGYRAVAFMNKGEVSLKSRNDKGFEKKFYPVVDALQTWKINAVVDGEIVVVDDSGISNFGALQNWRSEADGALFFYVFDIIWLDGRNLRDLPLSQRREILRSVVPVEGIIRISNDFTASGTEFFEAAKKMGLEGIMAKKSDSGYIEGRSKNWLKIKANKRQEMIIGGYTVNEDTSKLFSALLVGVNDNGRLHYTGKVGTGFNAKMQKEMMAEFKKISVDKPPFTEIPDINKPSRFRPNPPNATATWLKPVLVCEVSFTEMTSDGIMRHPSFEGMRLDKSAKEVVLEKPVSAAKTINAIEEKKMIKPAGKKLRKTLLNPTEKTQVKTINGHELKFTNLDKIYWPDEKIEKRELINYYYQIAPFILPYLKDRPQSMLRHPDGITGESFFYKDITGKAPDWVETYVYVSDADNRERNYLVAKDEASLLYMANLGAIEMNPWHSRVQKEDYPDWCIIDLDPGKTSFEEVIEAALVTRDVLENLGITGYPKTSGSSGIHVYIPLGAKYTYEQSREFARLIATLVHERIPDFTSIERAVKDRKGKMYIDFLQNRPQATVSAPYAVRPKPGATVSMPLEWSEVKSGLTIRQFTIQNAVARVRELGDIFKPVLGRGINMQKALAGI